MSEHESGSAYVGRVRDDTQKYIRALLHDVESLRVAATRLEAENVRLASELTNARTELELHRRNEQELRIRLVRICEESEQHERQFQEVETHNANLANLYVASYQLHGTLKRESVVMAIQEILVNLVGSEEIAILEAGSDGELEEVTRFGIDEDAVRRSRRDFPDIWRAALNGTAWIADVLPAEANGAMTACIPLKLDDQVTGIIVVFRLLGHKTSLEPLDHELFDLLATHAASALYSTSLRERELRSIA